MKEELLHWEDFEVDQTFTYGHKQVTREEIIEFAREFDPQPFHLDERAAGETPGKTLFGGLVASGWHTAGMFMRMMVDGLLVRSTSMGSPGIDSLRWLVPVRPGDVLGVRQKVLRKARHPRRDNIGFVDSRFEVFNQNDEVVLRAESSGMFVVRHPETKP